MANSDEVKLVDMFELETLANAARQIGTMPEPDMVNHPPHYTSHPSGVECIDIIEHMPFNVGAAVKYLWRAGLKGAKDEDLKKARWYIDREIQRLEKANGRQ